MAPTPSPRDVLADIVASDRLMFFTGSGISSGLLDKEGQQLPDWKTLLLSIAEDMNLSKCERKDVSDLLLGCPEGQEMIEAASILEQKDEDKFTQILACRLKPKEFEQQPADVQEEQEQRHKALLELQPRGILTLNIDRGHELALRRLGAIKNWIRINPLQAESEAAIRKWLAVQKDPFLFEAHGSLGDSDAGFVFSHRAYRDLLNRKPAYRALLRYLLSEYSFVFVGFGLTDLDFDQFLHEHAMDFGEPLRKHVVIRRGGRKQRDIRQAARYRRRFGIHVLNVDSYPDVWTEIRESVHRVGPELRKTLGMCLDRGLDRRQEGHRRLSSLGPAGRAVATGRLIKEIEREQTLFRVTEAIYSLGKLSFKKHEPARAVVKKALLEEIEKPQDTERLAHALTAVEHLLDQKDLATLERAAHRLRKIKLKVPRGFSDPNHRNPAYLEAIILRLWAKHSPMVKRSP